MKAGNAAVGISAADIAAVKQITDQIANEHGMRTLSEAEVKAQEEKLAALGISPDGASIVRYELPNNPYADLIVRMYINETIILYGTPECYRILGRMGEALKARLGSQRVIIHNYMDINPN